MPEKAELVRSSVEEALRRLHGDGEHPRHVLTEMFERFLSPKGTFALNTIDNPQDGMSFISPANGKYDNTGSNPVQSVTCQLLFEDKITGQSENSSVRI